jgi:beta-glucuronidase
MSRLIRKLEQAWRFAIDPEDKGVREEWFRTGLPSWKEIKVPHTFNIEPETATYRGSAWYSYHFTPNEEWEGKRVRIQFNGVYRDADIWLNGERIGQHYNAGFTTFTIDMCDKYKIGAINHLVVKVQNNYSTLALPYNSSFDWADDGGIFREVYFIISGKFAIDHVRIDAKPIISSYGNRITEAKATLEAKAVLLFGESSNENKSYEVKIYKGVDDEKGLIYQSDKMEIDNTALVTLPEIHFDKAWIKSRIWKCRA